MIKYNKRKSTFMLYLGILCSISLIGTMTGCERQPKNVMNNNGAPDKPCGVGRADANPKTVLPNDT